MLHSNDSLGYPASHYPQAAANCKAHNVTESLGYPPKDSWNIIIA